MIRLRPLVRFLALLMPALIVFHSAQAQPARAEPERIRVAIAPPEVLDLRPSPDTGDDNESGLARMLFEIVVEELERAGLQVDRIAGVPVGTPELPAPVEESGYRFAIAAYIMRDHGRYGIGLNVYHTADRYVVTSRSAFGTSELALSRAITRELQNLPQALREHRAAERVEREAAVRSITFATSGNDVAITLSDGRSLHPSETGRVTIAEVPYRIGQTIGFTVERPGYYPHTGTHRIRRTEETVVVPPLTRRTRFSLSAASFPAYVQGFTAVSRWYPAPDEAFFELSVGASRVGESRSLAKDIEKELDELEGGAVGAFRFTDLAFAFGAYPFVSREQPVRPGLQSGAGVMHATGDGWEETIPYLAPLNGFVSFGRGRVRARLVSSVRYTLGGDVLDRVWIAADGPLPYGRIEVAYTW